MRWTKQILHAVLIVLLQVLLFDRLQIGGWGYPMVYVVILMNIPVQMPRWIEMFIGAMLGLLVDIWSTSIGVNMAACILFSYLRPIFLAHMVQDIERVSGEVYSRSIGLLEYTKILSILVILHHFVVFVLEAWSWHNWWIIIVQTLISSILSLVLIMIYDMMKR
jgi:rod shape-determining protein MreD